MHFHQVICAFLVFVNHVYAKGYGGIGSSIGGAGGYGGGYGSEAGGYGVGYGSGQNLAPKPYGFGYQAPDPSGNSHFRKESGDASGNVQGSYGYTDQQGLYRQVDYVANEGGFKANVKTNEPGTDGKENPADVNVEAQQPPPGVQEKYTRPSGYGAGGGSGGIGGGNGGGSGGGGIGGGHGQIGGSSGYGGTSGIGGSGGYGGGYGGRSAGGSFKLGGGIGGSSGQFSGIQRSTSGKSGY